jgi:dUTPase
VNLSEKNMRQNMSKANKLKKQYMDEVNAHLERVRMASYRILYSFHGEGQGIAKNNALEAGFSVYLDDTIVVNAGRIHEVDTKVILRLPQGVIARVEASDKLIERGIHLACPTLSSAHDNHLKVHLNNLTNSFMPHKGQVILYKGTKVATVIVEPHSCEYFLERMDRYEQLGQDV